MELRCNGVTGTPLTETVASQLNDIGLVFGEAREPGLRSELFAEVNAVCVLPPGHRLSDKAMVVPEDLANETFISLGANDTTRHMVDNAFQRAGIKRVVRAEAQLATVVCDFVLDGFGVSVVNPFTALEYEERGLVLRPFRPEIPIRFQLVRPALQTQSALSESFVELLHRHCAECREIFQAKGLSTDVSE